MAILGLETSVAGGGQGPTTGYEIGCGGGGGYITVVEVAMICQVVLKEVATRLAEVMEKVVEKELESETVGIVVALTGGVMKV